jgi:hypothetical protein
VEQRELEALEVVVMEQVTLRQALTVQQILVVAVVVEDFL